MRFTRPGPRAWMTVTPGTLVSMEIRRARPGDAEGLVPLYAQWGYPQPAEAIAERLALWASTPLAEVLVAEAGGALAGVVGVCAAPHLALPGRYGRVGGLSVAAG